MPLPPVVVEIAPPDAPLPLRQALLSACSRAVHDSGCVEGDTAQAPSVVAIVSWRSGTHVRIDVALRPERAWETREIDFETTDAPEERWRAVGLAIGTLASAFVEPEGAAPSPSTSVTPPANAPTATPPAAPSAPPQKKPPAQPPPPPSPPEEVERRGEAEEPATERNVPLPPLRAFVDAGALAGPALQGISARVGGEVDGRLRVFDGGVFASLGAAYAASATTPSGVEITFLDGFVGLALARDFDRFSGLVHADAVLRRLALAIGPGDAGPRSGARWLGGARVGLEGIYWATPGFGIFVGASGDVLSGATDVQVTEHEVGRVGAFGYLVRAGVSVGIR